MNITLLGNGFDLYYKLPTKYINFLNTVWYLSTTDLVGDQTLGSIFGAEKLQKADSWILKSYQEYQECYDAVPISYEEIDRLTGIKGNRWYRYFWTSFNKDTGWIDFEKEIALVIQCLQERFELRKATRTYGDALSEEAEYIIEKFGFFVEGETLATATLEKSKKEYCTEYPVGSGNIILDREKIVDELANDLKTFTDVLKYYLHSFVEKLLPELIARQKIKTCDAIQYSDYVVTFNYSSTYEKFKLSDQVFHVHGVIEKDIILGTNPAQEDAVGHVDTTFIQFKKYYQRTMMETDRSYIRWVVDARDTREDVHLVVMGHSLDISDKDIISELFRISDEIVVLYHDQKAKSDYVSNLVKIFGSEEFSKLKYDRKLKFLDLNSDLSSLIKRRMETRSAEQSRMWLL